MIDGAFRRAPLCGLNSQSLWEKAVLQVTFLFRSLCVSVAAQLRKRPRGRPGHQTGCSAPPEEEQQHFVTPKQDSSWTLQGLWGRPQLPVLVLGSLSVPPKHMHKAKMRQVGRSCHKPANPADVQGATHIPAVSRGTFPPHFHHKERHPQDPDAVKATRQKS